MTERDCQLLSKEKTILQLKRSYSMQLADERLASAALRRDTDAVRSRSAPSLRALGPSRSNGTH
jgi:hypothetical protein